MAITPDTKDWTWVLRRTCPECEFDVRAFPRERVGDLIRENAARWPELLADPDARKRPFEDVWCGLEYGCHVRDVFALYEERLIMMLDQEDPQYPNWDQDATAVERRYGEQDPSVVARELVTAAGRLADRFDSVRDDQWERGGVRSDGARFTVESFARYLIHDPVHHIRDVEKGFSELKQG
jgi:hypothetical protein